MLQRIHIENFKSLKNVTLDLQRVNVFIGPNNSGKTNVLKALELSLHNEKINKLTKEQEKRLNFNFDPFSTPNLFVKYRTNEDDSLPIERELHIMIGRFPNNTFKFKNSENFFLVSNFTSYFGNTLLYFINSNSLTKPYPLLSGNQTVNEDASNLVAFLDFLRDQHPDLFQKIQSDLNFCIPELTQIRFENVTPTENDVKIFGDKTFKRLGLFDKTHNTVFWSDELSEGVLYFLALLCIIHQPNPPKLLLLEEPERGIHPRRIKEVIGFIKQLAYEKEIQVIMTTHSPLVLDEFAETPESVFIFDKDEEGATSIKNLQKDVIEPENAERAKKGMEAVNYTDALGENWTIGFLGGVPK